MQYIGFFGYCYYVLNSANHLNILFHKNWTGLQNLRENVNYIDVYLNIIQLLN